MNNILDVKVTTDIATEPVILAEAKAYLHVDFVHDDFLISMLVSSARLRLERYTGRYFGVKTIKLRAELFNEQELPYGPVNSVTSVSLLTDDSSTLITDYVLKGNEFKVLDTNSCGDYEVIYSAGYSQLPEDLKLAILVEVAYRYENRGDELIGLSNAAKDLAHPYRRLSTTV